MDKSSINNQFSFISRNYFNTEFFLLNMLTNLSIFILFFPFYPIQLNNFDLLNLFYFFSLDLFIFIIFPVSILRKEFKKAANDLKKNGMFKSFNGRILITILLTSLISFVISFFTIHYFKFLNNKCDKYFIILGSFIGLFSGLSFSSYFLNKYIKTKNNYKNLLNISLNENLIVKTDSKFPLFALFEIDDKGSFKNHTMKRILLFLFYSVLIWFFLFFIIDYSIQSKLSFSFEILILEIITGYPYLPGNFSYYAWIQIFNLFTKIGIYSNFEFKLLLFIIYFSLFLIPFLIITYFLNYKAINEQNFYWIKDLLKEIRYL